MDRLKLPAAVLLAVLLAGACTSGTGDASPTTSAPARVAPPVIREVFTLLGCDESDESMLGMEGCIEHEIVRLDRQIDAVAADLFTGLGSDDARRRFVAAERAWLRYRRLTCTSRGDEDEGGTKAGLDSAICTQEASEAHLAELRQFVESLGTP